MNRLLSLFAPLMLVLLAPAALAGPTSIAQLPLLNIKGTGTVKPNLMLLYDNSGSMTSTFTPDYVDDTSTCRARATMAGGTRGCRIGDPPFASADFNKQYYNPKVRYLPPVTASGDSFASMTRTYTTDWTSVTTDAFNIDNTDLLGASVTKTNLAAGFPDLRWCDGANNCSTNGNGYAFPNDERYTAVSFSANPYYYTINVAEYCTDTSLTNCRVTAINAPAPAGYPEPARVRWCDSRALTNCQAKYVGNFKYPRFSDPARAPDWYGTIAIGASRTTNSMTINNVKVVEPNGTFTLTNTAVTAASGTSDQTRRDAVAVALAASIIAKTGLATQYMACTSAAPTSSGVPKCSSYGIKLDSTSVVAVVPVTCSGAKSFANCTKVDDGSRAGRDLIVSSGSKVTALLTVTGTSNGSKNQVLSNLSFGSTQLFSSLSLNRGINASTVAAAIRTQIGPNGTVKPYVGGDTISPTCAANSGNNVICLVSDSPADEGDNIALGGISLNTAGNGNPYLRFTTTAGVFDGIPTDVTPTGASVFVRTDIVEGRVYPKVKARDDCAGTTTCTYDEEMTNFANWYAYYKTRNQMMKTAVGQAFQPIADNYNVGIVSLSKAAAEGAMTAPKPFSGSSRTAWYSALYGMSPSGSTPIRQALHAVGKMYANRAPYNYSAGNEVIQYPCQQNFTFVTTDGYWNGAAAEDVVNNDNVASVERFCSREKGCVDARTQVGNSLADVALYWYNGGSNDVVASLRPKLEDWKETHGLVPAADGDNTRLHMNTYTLGLGVDGLMTYDPAYDTLPVSGSDFHKLITGASGCPWNGGGTYVWPNPNTEDNSGSAAYQSRVDDLWHAAINGHGKYFSASDPQQVIAGLRKALSAIEITQGAAAAAATSTPNVSQADNDIFAATFTTVQWFGELQGKEIDITTGAVAAEPNWSASEQVGRLVSAASDERTIYMLDVPGRVLKPFDFLSMTDTEKAWFANKCTMLAQCSILDTDKRAVLNNGVNIVNWLRGQQQHADDLVMRAYTKTKTAPKGLAGPLPIVVGDIVSSKPAYLRDPRKAYPDPTYTAFKTENLARQPTVFVGANDGMLHAFNAGSGQEMWAYAPRITMKKLYLQAGTTYSTSHQFTVDGSPEVADVKIGDSWHTVLVAGLNAGGRGYYALDVTDPEKPTALWELCADPAVCTGDNFDEDIGLTFGSPTIGIWKNSAGVEYWAAFVSSGYNNIPGTDGVASGNGKGYLYVVDIATGKVLQKTTTGAGDATTPSGLARLTAISDNPHTDARVTYVYGGDNLGQMWRFDFTSAGAPKLTRMGNAGVKQPVTTRPEVTTCEVAGTAADGSATSSQYRVVAFGTGRLLDLSDIANTDVQSAYVLKDTGAEIAGADWRGAKMAKQTLAKIENTTSYTINGVKIDLPTQQGWYLDFNLSAGERVNLDPQIIYGGVNIVTNTPSNSTSCDVGGTSNVYQLNVCTGEPLTSINVGPPNSEPVMVAGQMLSNSAAAVGSILITLPKGNARQITTNANGSMTDSAVHAAISAPATRGGWRRVRE